MAESDLKLYDQAHLFDHLTTKQRQILSAAIDVFAEYGYANASTKLVAQKAKVAEGNIFAKFKNKAGLLDAILQPVMTQIVPKIFSHFVTTNAADVDDDLENLIRPLVEERISFLMANAKVLKLLFSELAYSQARRDQLAQVIPAAQVARMTTVFATLKQRGILVDWPDTQIYQVLWSMVGGAAVNYLFFQQKPDSKRIVVSILKVLRP
ncbi:TetR/AcrR family transcriptional regulator [Lacticaseibacillus manihotivorans]|jgi:AcrR family transcriptional regulator|uniref:TetR family transcriptional regulator n=2 Tax=Lacticaseibacillus manihotivorans TaxID=88233 RepID=A0A0R1QT28_9LACO|nr:TetR/AcrR family transcriptional regulator [Lacticaseibacillus manihotivorans]KRL44339.1 TetR family transcriptional regulator [Lacticaseibacillus manihotivorans DSM 13343 = JCM 12514]QFQ91725.1 TetR family transcriptional regulator [Lacticaseibacillus manihotivorans]